MANGPQASSQAGPTRYAKMETEFLEAGCGRHLYPAPDATPLRKEALGRLQGMSSR